MKAIIWILGTLIPTLGFSQTMTEVLGRPTNNSITVSVLFDSPADVYFEYGISKGSYTNTTQIYPAVSDSAVEAKINGLQPATRYYYRTRYRKSGVGTYSASDIHSFTTQRSKGTTFRFTIEADPHPYDKKGCWPLWDICLANQLKDTADFMIDMGDTFGDDHNPYTIASSDVKQLQLNCREFFGKVCHSLPFFFCIGNHEGEGGYYLLQTPPNNLAMYETKWRKLFYPNPYPDGFYTGNSIPEANGVGLAENYFAWVWGDALFVVLDMYRYASKNDKPQKWDWTIGKDQYDWFKQTLENSTAKHKFVFSHHILGQGRGGVEIARSFEWGGYDAGTYKFDSQRPGWGLPIHQLMKKNKVDVYFQGHDHIYVQQMLDSIIYQAVPMPSDSSYKIGVTDNGDAYLSGKQLGGSGHLRVTVTSDSITVDYVSALLPKDEIVTLKNGQIVYSYSIVKKDGKITFKENNIDPNDPPKTDTTKTPTAIINSYRPSVNSVAWKIYPNPAKGKVSVSFNNPTEQMISVAVYGIDGRLMKSIDTIDSSTQSTSLGTFQPGIYIISVTIDKIKTAYQKLVVN